MGQVPPRPTSPIAHIWAWTSVLGGAVIAIIGITCDVAIASPSTDPTLGTTSPTTMLLAVNAIAVIIPLVPALLITRGNRWGRNPIVWAVVAAIFGLMTLWYLTNIAGSDSQWASPGLMLSIASLVGAAVACVGAFGVLANRRESRV